MNVAEFYIARLCLGRGGIFLDLWLIVEEVADVLNVERVLVKFGKVLHKL